MGIEGIISQQFFWCFGASQTLYNGRKLERELQTQLDNFWTTLTNTGIIQDYKTCSDVKIFGFGIPLCGPGSWKFNKKLLEDLS